MSRRGCCESLSDSVGPLGFVQAFSFQNDSHLLPLITFTVRQVYDAVSAPSMTAEPASGRRPERRKAGVMSVPPERPKRSLSSAGTVMRRPLARRRLPVVPPPPGARPAGQRRAGGTPALDRGSGGQHCHRGLAARPARHRAPQRVTCADARPPAVGAAIGYRAFKRHRRATARIATTVSAAVALAVAATQAPVDGLSPTPVATTPAHRPLADQRKQVHI